MPRVLLVFAGLPCVSFLLSRKSIFRASLLLLAAWCFVPAEGQDLVGTASATLTATVTVATAGTVGSISVLTQGATGKDFAFVSGGTCAVGTTYAAGSLPATCTVEYTFTPSRPGQRLGAIVLENDAATSAPLGTALLVATGTGPLATFPGSTALSTVGSGFSGPQGVALDGAGDVFVADTASGTVYEIEAGTGGNPAGVVSAASTVVTVGSGFSGPTALAVDGAGDVFVADSGNNAVYEIEAGTGGNAAGAVSSASTTVTVGSGFNSPKGTVVDASGDVFVADSGNNAVKEIEAGTGGNAQGVVSSASTVVTVSSGFDAPQGIAFDGIGDLFVADSGNSAVKEIEARTGRGLGPVSSASTVVTVGSGFDAPKGIAVDGAGDVFVTDSGNSAVKEIEAGTGGDLAPVVSSASTVVTVGSGFDAPQGIALDGAGDLFVADTAVKELVLTVPPALSFASTAVGSTSSDSPQTVVVQNAGNASLAFSSISLGGNPNFPLFGTTTCSTSTALDESGLCTVAADFSPVQPGAQSSTITLIDDSLNVSGSAQAISLSGTAVAATGTTAQTITFPQPPTPAQTNTTAGLTASASSGLTVIYSVVSGPATVSGSTVTYTGVGTVVLEADQYGNGTYAAASPVQVTVAVTMTGSVGTASATATVTIATAGTVGAISVLTQGATGKDFQYASGGTCAVGTTYAAGSTCTVEYTFTSTRPGQRQGAIVLESNASPAAPLGTALLAATGTGPLATFPGSTALSVVSSGYSPEGVAVDGAGDVFVEDYYNQVVKEIEAGTGGNALGVVSASSTVVTVGSGFSYPHGGLAVDGAGDVFVGGDNSSVVKEIEAGTGGNAAGMLSFASTVVTVGSGFNFPRDVAVDGAGNVFVGDTGNDALYEIEAGTGGNAPGAVSSSSTVVTVRSGFDSSAVAVDGAGDVFVLDGLASVVYEIEAGTGGNAAGAVSSSSTMVTVGSGFYYPFAVAVDAAGDVFVADWGNNAVKEIEAGTGGNAPGVVSSSSTVVTLGSGFSSPIALAVDGAGNVFITDPGLSAVRELVLTTPPSLSFASTAVGSTSSDSPQTVVVQNAGNASLSFPVPGFGSNPSLSADFTLGNTSTCPQVTSSSGSAGTLASSGLCTEALSFTPTTAGSITGSLVLTDDSLNPGTTTTQTINLSGTATPATATVTVQPATIVYGSTPTTLTASISYAGTIAPIGAVTFTVDSGTAVTASCTGSSSSLTCTASYATGSLGAGTHTITVSMVADTNYSAASGTAALTVTQATPTVSFAIPNHAYGDAPFTVAATSNSTGGFTYKVISGAATVAGSTVTITGTGAVTIEADESADSNYSEGSQQATFTVTAATLTLTGNNATRPYGAANPAFTGSVSGAKYSDSFTESFATSANATSAPGAYAIVPSVTGANVGDYSVSATNGTLTVTQAATVTAVSASAVSVNPSQSVTLTATVASTTTGTPTGSVTFYDNGTSLQQVSLNNGSASLTTLLSAGSTHTITVTYSGDTDFLGGSASATGTVSVTALDFTFSATPATSSEAVVPGGLATYTFNIAPPYGSYGGPVTFTITGLPAGATASFSPAVIAANAGPQSITLTVQTAQPLARNDRQSPFRKELPLTALLLLPLMSSCKLRRRWNSRLLMLALLVAALGGSTLLSGCGAEQSGFLREQPASYTLTVTATSGQEQHSQTVTLIVQ